jgi:hypothetical protein
MPRLAEVVKDAAGRQFLLLWLSTALFVTGVRGFYPVPMNYDLTL